ncbi:MAG: ribosome assembly cofactor RimP [Mariniphaga sp.]|jgi:ribosome maturation factor RimP|nr:ribosome assembly cofactor RimP [Mariniphaga sp.]
MLDKIKIEEIVKEKLDNQTFLVDIRINKSNVIQVYVDSYEGLSINRCAEISRHLESRLDRDKEDFELQVSSPGLTESFKVREQFLKNIGREVEIITTNAVKLTGTLKKIETDFILLEVSTKEKVEGEKKKKLVTREHQIDFKDIKSAKVVISFK